MKQYVFFALLLCGIIFPQKIDDTEFLVVFGGKAFNKFFEPVLLDTNYYQVSNLMQFIGGTEVTKGSKDSGGTKFVDWVMLWRDTTTLMNNGTFDSDISGWTELQPIDTLEWAASGGGFTGTMRMVESSSSPAVVGNFTSRHGKGIYHIQADFNVIANTGFFLAGYNLDGVDTYLILSVGETGLMSIDDTLYFNGNEDFYFAFGLSGNGEVYIDNVSVIPLADSVSGNTYNLGITEGNDSSWYYWRYYGFWKQKDKDTIWVYSNIDSVYIPDYLVYSDINITTRGQGSITGNGGQHYWGESITLTAVPADGYSFAGWSGDTTTTNAELAFTMPDSNVTLTARFTIDEPLARVIINEATENPLHASGLSTAFIAGYECIEGSWGDNILTIESSLSTVLVQNDTIGASIVVRSTTGMEGVISLAESYTPDIMTFMPAGSNSHTQVYNSGGTLPDLIVTGAGDTVNETGYDIEFHSPDPITGEPDLSSFSNAYIAGVMMYLADTLGVTLWQVRDTLRARLGDSWASEDGYGLVDCDLVATIVGGGGSPAAINYMITADGDTMFTADGDTMKTLGFIQFDFLQQLNNGEKNETDFISNRSVFAVLSERKRTVELCS